MIIFLSNRKRLYFRNLEQEQLSDALNGIAISFIPDKDQSKKIVLENFKDYPLHMLISQSVFNHEGRVVSVIDSINQDLEGHIVRDMYDSIRYNLVYLKLGFEYLIAKRELNIKFLSEHLFKCPFFEEKYKPIVIKKFRGFF